MDHTHRNDLQIGMLVEIVKKEDQPTGKLTRGYIQRLLTNKKIHPRGIKVELTNGAIGRVQHILTKDEIRLENFKFYNQFFFHPYLYSIWDQANNRFLLYDYQHPQTGTIEKTVFLFDDEQKARDMINGSSYDPKLYPVRRVQRKKPLFDLLSPLGVHYVRINSERKLSLERLKEWEFYFKNMR